MFFPRKRYGWGPPDTWQGWVFLALWVASFAAVASQPLGVMHGVMALALIGFLLFVASR